MGAAMLQPYKTAVPSGCLGRRGAGVCLGRTMRLVDVVNWGFIEVLYQFGLNKGHLFGAGKPQWPFLHGWLLQVEVGWDAGGIQEMPTHNCSPRPPLLQELGTCHPTSAGLVKPLPGHWLPV